MSFESHDYVNSPLNNDLGRVLKYEIHPVNKGNGKTAYEVMRYNPSGQGWHIVTYDNQYTAEIVAAILKTASDKEVH